MNNKWTTGIVGLIVGVLVVIGIFSLWPKTSTLGGSLGVKLAENYDNYIKYNGGYYSALPISTTGGVVIGSSGTTLNNVSAGACYIAPYATTIGASSTVAVDCQATLAWNANGTSALTGVQKGDNVQFELSTTTANQTYGGLDVLGASASTTAGHIQVILFNQTGATYTWPTTLGTASGTATYISNR